MKKLVNIVLFLPLLVLAQTTTENYIKNTTYKVKTEDGATKLEGGATLTNDNKIENITYFDGLGRPKQTIAKQAGGNKQDIITPIVYDDFNRQVKDYLPYADPNQSSGTSNLNYRTQNAAFFTDLNNLYLDKFPNDLNVNSPNPYSEKYFEASPLNRIIEQAAPGSDWSLKNGIKHTIRFSFEANNNTDVELLNVVSYWNSTFGTYDYILTKKNNAFYMPNELYKTITYDENYNSGKNHSSEEFKDKQGRIILKRTYANINGTSTPHNTHYVYDKLGNLIFVIPSLAEQNLMNAPVAPNFTDFSVTFNKSIFMPIGSGGGTASVTITNNIMNVNFSMGGSPSLPNTNPIDLNTNIPIPDIYLGIVSGQGTNNPFGMYSANIINGKLQLNLVQPSSEPVSTGGYGSQVSSLSGSFTVDLSVIAADQIANQSVLDNLCYQYKYDQRNRLVEKKIPGKGWEYIVYDNLDRPVLTQDAVQKPLKKWLFTKYDQLGRVIYTGIYTHASDVSRASMQTTFKNKSEVQNYEEKQASIGSLGIYYSNSDFPTSSIEVLTVNYYDNYTFNRAGTGTSVSNIYGVNSTTQLKGLVTGSRIKVLGTEPNNYWITTVTYYDDKARPIYIYSKNDYLLSTDVLKSELDFTGKVIETTSTHTKTDDNISETIITIDHFNYDHVGRLIKQTQSGTKRVGTEVIVENTYDELGQLERKQVGGKTTQTRLQDIDYKYNVRGWLKTINDTNTSNASITLGSEDLFGFEINYNNPTDSTKALYNGNISQTLWKTSNLNNPSGNLISTKYTYSYDALNRITAANDNTGRHDVYGIEYDKNGNITKLKRKGYLNTNYTLYGLMDNLTYTYQPYTNKLLKVSDAIVTPSLLKGEFKDDYNYTSADPSNDYTYDANGNMLRDYNKNMTSNILYNHLNLPTRVNINSQHINYVYDATGTKLRKTVGTEITDYAGNYIYKKTGSLPKELQFFNHPEGYVQNTNGNFSYIYQYKDHLGNVRLSYRDINPSNASSTDLEIVEESNYYPFGLKHKGYNDVKRMDIGNPTAQKFGYNGKELEESLGLGLIDLGARFMDPAIGRFTTIDPLTDIANYQSPYVIADNNPVVFVDIHGLGILNVLGNLWRRLKNAVKNVSRECNQPSGEESLFDSWRKPDFPGINKLINEAFKGKGGNKKSKDKPSTTTQSRSSVSVIGVIPVGIGDIQVQDPTGDIINKPPTGFGGGGGDLGLVVPSELAFGSLHLKKGAGGSGLISRNIQLGNDPSTKRSLKLISEVLLLDPKVKMRITFNDPKGNYNEINQAEVAKYNKKKFQVLASYLEKNFSINPGRISYSEEGKGGKLIFTGLNK
ncbi:DUF6443 domain-containing protein [Polaribacter vadi]|mgnify:CR=1 FL=1|uniref:DUF6443 domain-containing protein n=1 Tax=Polaribacter vadi TaxID=1774273 RepID=UPI0030ED7EA4|tara:strand:- start:61609 stop:65625 length:4017 start_codon:yes stop_codon:yes gene_type:complete